MFAVTGASDHIDGFQAGRVAAGQVEAGLGRPDVLICFASVHLDQSAVLAGVRSVFPDAPLVGGSSGATITEAGWRKRSVALIGLQSDTIRFAIGMGRDTHKDSRAAGRVAATTVQNRLEGVVRTLLPLPHAVVGCDHADLLAGLQEVLPDTPIIGGASAMDGLLDPSHPLFLRSYQYLGDTVSEWTAPVLGMGWADGTVTDAFAWGHGFLPIGITAEVTRSTGTVVQELDGMPALEYFRKYLGEGFDFRVDAALLPLGVDDVYDEGTTVMRVSPALEPLTDGSVRYIIPVPAGQAVHLVRTTRTELIQSARTTAETLMARLAGRKPQVLFMFSCGGRHALLGDRCAEELKQVQQVVSPDVPIIGLQAGGEFAPIAAERGRYQHPGMYGHWHNYSLCLYALAE